MAVQLHFSSLCFFFFLLGQNGGPVLGYENTTPRLIGVHVAGAGDESYATRMNEKILNWMEMVDKFINYNFAFFHEVTFTPCLSQIRTNSSVFYDEAGKGFFAPA